MNLEPIEYLEQEEPMTAADRKYEQEVERFLNHDCHTDDGQACQSCAHFVNSLKIE